MPNPTGTARRPLAGLLCAAAILLAGCEEAAEDAPNGTGVAGTAAAGDPTDPTDGVERPATGAEREPDQVYTVRGEIQQLPDPENPAKSLQIKHENIPEFVNREGEVAGMAPMIMPFTPAPGLDLSGLSIGDKVRFTFDVDWDGPPPFLLTEIAPLPPETELDFSRPGP